MEFSLLLPFMVTAVGFLLLFKLKFFFILHPIKTARELIIALKDRAGRRSLCLALAGTLGVGNIFGVAAGILIGGAGSLFWLFLSSFFSMVIKYAETLLTFDEASPRGGMSGVIFSVFRHLGWLFAPLYALFTVALALFMGSAIQAEAVIDVARQTVGLDPFITAFVLIILFAPCIIGGTKRIENLTEIIIPLTTIIYILMCFCVIFMNTHKFPEVFFEIITDAFSGRAIVGGASVIAIKEGFARGILSNEAGVGTSALAHSRAEGRTPRTAGLFGICEVFFDTTLLCTLTGLAILLSVNDYSACKTPMSLVTAAFTSTLGNFSGYILLVLIFAFAYSTVICWYYYGSECASLYFPRLKPVFTVSFPVFFLLPAVTSSAFLLYVTDCIILLMAFLTLLAIIKKKDRIRDLSFEKL